MRGNGVQIVDLANVFSISTIFLFYVILFISQHIFILGEVRWNTGEVE